MDNEKNIQKFSQLLISCILWEMASLGKYFSQLRKGPER